MVSCRARPDGSCGVGPALPFDFCHMSTSLFLRDASSSVDATALGRLPDAADFVFGEPGSVLARALELGLSTCGSTAEETLKPAVMSDEGKAKTF